jgi:uncharacterized RDD family membrane protein YckC
MNDETAICPECGHERAEDGSCPTCDGTPPAGGTAEPVWDATQLPKASSLARLVAVLVDDVIAVGPMLLLGAIGWYVVVDETVPSTWSLMISIGAYALGIFWPLYYILTRDGWGHGQGWGKRLFGLLVVKEDDGTFGTKGGSAVRALILGIIWYVEALVVLARRDGRRIGDVLARTRVASEQEYAATDAPGAAEVREHPASKTWPLVALILAAMLIAASVGLINFGASRLAPRPVSDDVAEDVYEPGSAEALRVVEGYYGDILSGSYDAAMSRMDMPREQEFAVVSVYSDADALLDRYEMGSPAKEGEVYVVTVDETFANEAGETFERDVTYTLSPGDGALLITEVASTTFDPISNAESPLIYPRDGEDIVESFLGFVAAGDYASARDLSSERFIAEHPEYFDGSLGQLDTWQILGSEQLTSERLRVRAEEPWSSGEITVDYQVALEVDVLLIDAARIVE